MAELNSAAQIRSRDIVIVIVYGSPNLPGMDLVGSRTMWFGQETAADIVCLAVVVYVVCDPGSMQACVERLDVEE
jgi:hypothetical protein